MKTVEQIEAEIIELNKDAENGSKWTKRKTLYKVQVLQWVLVD